MNLKEKEIRLKDYFGLFSECSTLLNFRVDEKLLNEFPKQAERLIKWSTLACDNGYTDSKHYIVFVNLLYKLVFKDGI